MVTQVKAPQLYLPTGYEGLQQSAAAKRKIADAMWASGMMAIRIKFRLRRFLEIWPRCGLESRWARKLINLT